MFNPLQQCYIDSLKNQIEQFESVAKVVLPHTLPDVMQVDNWWVDEWNRIHCKQVDLRNEFFADYCEEIILKAKKYYYAGAPIMSDARYDSMESSLKSLRPSSKVLEKVGT